MVFNETVYFLPHWWWCVVWPVVELGAVGDVVDVASHAGVVSVVEGSGLAGVPVVGWDVGADDDAGPACVLVVVACWELLRVAFEAFVQVGDGPEVEVELVNEYGRLALVVVPRVHRPMKDCRWALVESSTIVQDPRP